MEIPRNTKKGVVVVIAEMGRSVNRVAIDFADGSRAIVEKARFDEYIQNGNVTLDFNMMRAVKYLIESMEKRNWE